MDEFMDGVVIFLLYILSYDVRVGFCVEYVRPVALDKLNVDCGRGSPAVDEVEVDRR